MAYFTNFESISLVFRNGTPARGRTAEGIGHLKAWRGCSAGALGSRKR